MSRNTPITPQKRGQTYLAITHRVGIGPVSTSEAAAGFNLFPKAFDASKCHAQKHRFRIIEHNVPGKTMQTPPQAWTEEEDGTLGEAALLRINRSQTANELVYSFNQIRRGYKTWDLRRVEEQKSMSCFHTSFRHADIKWSVKGAKRTIRLGLRPYA